MKKSAPDNLRVFVIVNRLFEWSQNFITREMVELKSQGVELLVGARTVIEREDLTDDEKSLKTRFIQIPENPFTPGCLFRHAIFKVKNPVVYIQAWQQFITFGHRRPKLGRSLVCLFRAAAIAEKIKIQQVDLIHAHFLTAPTETALYLSILTKIPFGCTAHAMDIYKDNSGMLTKIQKANYVVTCTNFNAEFLQNVDKGVNSKLFAIHHGLALSKEHEQKAKPINSFTFLAVGRFVPKKGYEYLLEACQSLKEAGYRFKCKIVGEGPLEESFREQIRARCLHDTVDLPGYVPPHTMSQIYDSCHALVMPSIIDEHGDRDGLPNVCLEALAHGLPIIGTNISGIPEAITNGVNGMLIPAGDSQALSKAMMAFLEAKDLSAMRTAARNTACEKFDVKKNVSALYQIMKKYRN
ncbi:MAG: glycosyltransferase family 4 protein [bacterium]